MQIHAVSVDLLWLRLSYEGVIGLPRLSAIIITRDEAANIVECLHSVAFCDERIVVDCGSRDETVRLAEQAGARVVVRAWEGFGAQKNFALSLATGEWLLSIDADERVSRALAAEIDSAVKSGRANGYEIPRSSIFCGRRMRHSGWHLDYVLRLFRRGRARFSDRLVHEDVICEAPVARLREPLIHYPIATLEDALSKIDRYSTAGAAMLTAEGRRVRFGTGIVRGIAAFLRTYILKRGFFDGREGFLVAIYNAETTYYRYMKAWLAARQDRAKADGEFSSPRPPRRAAH
jgi:glycosyltransferase involved in cell wall biosynthesis